MSIAYVYQNDYSSSLNSLLSVDLFLSLVIFLGALFVLLKNKHLPKWHVTPLWYIGITSLLSVLSVVFQWTFGKDFPLSYFNVGVYIELATKAFLAWIAATFFVVTLIRCYKRPVKTRRKQSLIK